MIAAVCKDANRIYRLFCARNPSFAKNGKVSIIAHSLGSALTADILSSQATFVKPLSEMSSEEQKSETQFIFDCRNVFLVGSPLAFFLHLGRGQLIARRGRERTQNVERGIALTSPRYGCLAADAVYNIYNSTDPVAFSLNATVDSNYASKIAAIAIPSSNVTLVQNLSETYNKVTKIFDVTNFFGGGGNSSNTGEEYVEAGEVEKLVRQKLDLDKAKPAVNSESGGKKKVGPPVIKRPGTGLKRMPSEKPMSAQEYEKISRAEKRFVCFPPRIISSRLLIISIGYFYSITNYFDWLQIQRFKSSWLC